MTRSRYVILLTALFILGGVVGWIFGQTTGIGVGQ